MIQHEIIGDDMQPVIITMAQGEQIRAEAGARARASCSCTAVAWADCGT